MNFSDNLSDLYAQVRRQLKDAGIQTADQDARIIILGHTGFDWADIIAGENTTIAPAEMQKIGRDIQKKLAGEPVSRIFSERQFWGLNFKLSRETLDPRPETETLVEAALKSLQDNPPETILDLGTGSGCIITALLKEWPDSRGVAVDKSPGALKTARWNAANHDVGKRISCVCGNWGSALGGKFDLIVSNPPYIPNQIIQKLDNHVKNHDPILALDGGEDGLKHYRSIFMETSGLLKKSGIAFFEIGYNQKNDVVRLAEESGLSVKRVHHDLAGQLRVVEISCGDN